MNILWLSHVVPYPPKRGVLIRSYNLVKELSGHHTVDLIAFNQKALIAPYFGDFKRGTEKAFEEVRKHCRNVEFVLNPADKQPKLKLIYLLQGLMPLMKPYSVAWQSSREYKRVVRRFLQENSYDLVHCDTLSLAQYVSSFDGIPVSLDHHNIESDMMFRRATLEKNIIRKMYFFNEARKLQAYEKRYCGQFATNLVCSELDKTRLQDISKSASAYIVPNMVDTNSLKPTTTNPEKFVFLFVGTMTWYPNVSAIRRFANEVWPALKKRYPKAVVQVIGAHPPKDLLEFSQQEKDFQMLGFVDDLNPYFEKATGYICPIFDGGGTKLKMLDAFSAGKAIVAHPVACEGLNVQDEEQVLMASTPEEYVEQLGRIASDENLRCSLGKRARRFVEENYSASGVGRSLSAHFKSLIESRGEL